MNKIQNTRFIPSTKLVEQIIDNMIQPDKETTKAFEELKQYHKPAVGLDFADDISEHIEGLFANLSRRTRNTNKPLQLSDGLQFTSDICMKLIVSIDLDSGACNTLQVLTLLHYEFSEFVSTTPFERSWGKIVIDNSELKIIPIDDTSNIYDIDKIDDVHWY